MAFEAVTHDKHENDKYQKNLHILKLITKAALRCSGRDCIPIPPRTIKLQGRLSRNMSEQRKLYCNNKRFCKTRFHFTRPFKKWRKKCKNDIMENPE